MIFSLNYLSEIFILNQGFSVVEKFFNTLIPGFFIQYILLLWEVVCLVWRCFFLNKNLLIIYKGRLISNGRLPLILLLTKMVLFVLPLFIVLKKFGFHLFFFETIILSFFSFFFSNKFIKNKIIKNKFKG